MARRYSDSAKIVAKTLKSLGFKNCYIVTDGFSGGRGWLQSRLGTDSYNFSFAQVLSPSRIIPAGTRSFGTRSGTKFLPSSDWKHERIHSLKVLFYIPLFLNFERSFDKIFELLLVYVEPEKKEPRWNKTEVIWDSLTIMSKKSEKFEEKMIK